jgi:NAD(P)-dependent dehydrogenase (short-subunit alcohol dehydrogenase family)
MLMRSVARSAGPEGIRANAICPGPVDTLFARDFAAAAGQSEPTDPRTRAIPLGRVATPHDIVGTVLFLASDRSAYLTGAALPLDGGMIA